MGEPEIKSPEHRSVRQEKLPPTADATEVAPGVIRVQLTIAFPGLGHVNCYAMEDKRGIALVDPGLPGRKPWLELVSRLKQAGLPIERVHTVVVTHSHPDHFGAAGRIRQLTGAEIVTQQDFKTFFDPNEEDDTDKDLADGADLDSWDSGRSNLIRRGERRARTMAEGGRLRARTIAEGGRHQVRQWRRWNGPTPWGGPHPRPPRRVQLSYAAQQLSGQGYFQPPKPSRRVVDGQVLSLAGRDWVAVHTPGHTVDHLCLLDPAEGIFISGDHVLPTITPHISGLVNAPDPLKLYFDSLQRMQTIEGVLTVLPAHGLVFNDLHQRAADIQAHHHERLELLRLAGPDLGEASVGDYSQRLFKPTSWGPMADSETYAHLEHLVCLGQASRHNPPAGALRYRLKD